MKKAFLIEVTQIIRVIACNENQAVNMAVIEAQAQADTLCADHVSEVREDTDRPYDAEKDGTGPISPDNLLKYCFGGYSVLDVIAMAGNDEHVLNAAEAKQVLDLLCRKYEKGAADLSVMAVNECIATLVSSRDF